MAQLHSRREGSGPLLVLSHALGLDLRMWDGVAACLRDRFTVLRYDHRCHGGSQVVAGPWSVDDLADDAAALIAAASGGRPVTFIGLSLGGMTGQSLAARHPALVERLVIVNSAAHYPDRSPWDQRITTVRAQRVQAVADGAVERWLTPAFRATAAGAAAAARLRETLLSNPAEAYADSCAAVAAIDFRDSNRRVAAPTLVVAGEHDLATPLAMSREIAGTIPAARLASLPTAHISSVEQPAALAALIADFAAGCAA